MKGRKEKCVYMGFVCYEHKRKEALPMELSPQSFARPSQQTRLPFRYESNATCLLVERDSKYFSEWFFGNPRTLVVWKCPALKSEEP